MEIIEELNNNSSAIWLTPKATAGRRNWPIGGIRHLIFFAKQNGFHKCIRRIGRKILINQQLFDQWIEEQGGKK